MIFRSRRLSEESTYWSSPNRHCPECQEHRAFRWLCGEIFQHAGTAVVWFVCDSGHVTSQPPFLLWRKRSDTHVIYSKPLLLQPKFFDHIFHPPSPHPTISRRDVVDSHLHCEEHHHKPMHLLQPYRTIITAPTQVCVQCMYEAK